VKWSEKQLSARTKIKATSGGTNHHIPAQTQESRAGNPGWQNSLRASGKTGHGTNLGTVSCSEGKSTDKKNEPGAAKLKPGAQTVNRRL
jgi:hypothetical protein